MDVVTIQDVALKGRRVLVRVDFNVPMKDDGSISDDTRIREALPTIEYLRAEGAKVILISHLGRPGGRRVHRFSLAPVAERLSQLLGTPVHFSKEWMGDVAEEAVNALSAGDILMLENIRFDPREEQNDPGFVRELAQLGDLFVNDAFGTAHRAHASTVGLARALPAVAGLLMAREIEALSALRDHAESPYMALLGGAKISDKLQICRRLIDRVDAMLVGGGLANTFLACLGHSVGNSLYEKGMIPEVRRLIADAKRKNVDLLMPLDVVIAPAIQPAAPTRIVDVHSVDPDWAIVDIGPRTTARYTQKLQEARTVFWNGPMGVFEISGFAKGTRAMAETLAALTGAHKVVGGGESAEAVRSAKLTDRMNHVSTGGGAALEFLSGTPLPGIESLQHETATRRLWMGANWKMNVPSEQVEALAQMAREEWRAEAGDLVIFPSFTELKELVRSLEGSGIAVGGQDCHWDVKGSYTGAVSAPMLFGAGARYTLVGHSECRAFIADTDDRVAEKLNAALDGQLTAVLCLGESLSDREAGQAEARVTEQLQIALQPAYVARGPEFPWAERLVVAYEPVWAIGTGHAATLEQVAQMTQHLRAELRRLLDPWVADGVRVVYGGSVDAGNVSDLLALSAVDGVLVGTASSQAEALKALLQAVKKGIEGA